MTIDDRLAFGEHVSIPIRREKTAERKWNELRGVLGKQYAEFTSRYFKALSLGDDDVADKILNRRSGVSFALEAMDKLDGIDHT